MDTYGDMVTLLLCFFVLLYSMSTISEENWKALVMSFNPLATETLTATPGGDGPNADADEAGGPVDLQEQIDEDIEEFYQELTAFIAQAGEESNISVTKDGGKIYISFNQVVFFDGDSPVLKEEAKPILDTVSEMLSMRRSPLMKFGCWGIRRRQVRSGPITWQQTAPWQVSGPPMW